jgi:Family of unknown function (DUF6459)
VRCPLSRHERLLLRTSPECSSPSSSGPAVPVGSLVRVVAQEQVPGLAEVTALVRRAGRVVPVAMRLDGANGCWELVELQY